MLGRWTVCIVTRTESNRDELVQLQAATIGHWNAVGAQLEINNVPTRLNATEEYRGRWTGAYWASHKG